MKWEYFIISAILLITGVIMLIIPTNTIFAYKTKTASTNEQTQKFCNVLSAVMTIVLGVASAIALVLTRNAETGLFGLKNMDDSVMLIVFGGVCAILADSEFLLQEKISGIV